MTGLRTKMTCSLLMVVHSLFGVGVQQKCVRSEFFNICDALPRWRGHEGLAPLVKFPALQKSGLTLFGLSVKHSQVVGAMCMNLAATEGE